MAKKYYKKLIWFLFLAAFVISLATLLYFYSPTEIVEFIGVDNALIFIFALAFFAGFSAWTSFSLIAMLITFVIGGINPLYLGLVAGVALAIGDMIMFYISSKGRELIVGKWKKRLDKFSKKFHGKLRKLIPFFSYIYIGLTPLPNDFLIIFLAMVKYPIKKIYIPIILGDITFPIVISFLASKGILLFN